MRVTYDGASPRIATVTDPDGNVLSYTSDACGERASMSLTVGNTTVTDLDYTYPPSPLRDYGGTSTDGRLTQIDAAGSAGVPTGLFSYSYLCGSNLVSSLVHALTGEDQVPLTTTRLRRRAAPDSGGQARPRFRTLVRRRLGVGGWDAADRLWFQGKAAREDRDSVPSPAGASSTPRTPHCRGRGGSTILRRRPGGSASGALGTVTLDAFDAIHLHVRVAHDSGGQVGNHLRQEKNGTAFTARDPPSHKATADATRNLTSDGQWTYTWDTENRLVAMETLSGPPASPWARLTFTYDADWRRRTKSVYAWATDHPGAPEPGEGGWSLTTSHLFLYDQAPSSDSGAPGWNLIRELITDHTQTPAVTTAKTCTWGLDLSQTLQGAGGVGGLLAVTCHSTPAICHFFCDDGNGSVTTLVSAANGSVAAQYDDSPFGETLLATGRAAEASPFQFSTKHSDAETGLVDDGCPHMNPVPGRRLGRDALSESEFASLFSFGANTPAGAIDSEALTVRLVVSAKDAFRSGGMPNPQPAAAGPVPGRARRHGWP